MRHTCGCLWRWRNPSDLQLGVAGLEHTMGPTVRRIRYTIGEDSDGDPAIHFRVVLDDPACGTMETLCSSVNRIEREINERLDLDNSGLQPYWNYRSWSEVSQMQDKSWE